MTVFSTNLASCGVMRSTSAMLRNGEASNETGCPGTHSSNRWVAVFAPIALVAAAPSPPQAKPAPPVAAPAPVPVYTLQIVARYKHDPSAFTQGLLWHDGVLYESTGKEGRSEVRRVALDGRILARRSLPSAQQFGEGMALWKDALVSLTWTNGIAYRWNAKTLKPIGQHRYTGEGWGLTAASNALILSDGTSVLRFLNPETLAEQRRVTVTIRGRKLDQLNELEMVDGQILANVWRTNFIVAIEPTDGRVAKVIDASALVAEVAPTDTDAVLNGIAWDAAGKRLFVTGKLWPTLFEVRVVPAK